LNSDVRRRPSQSTDYLTPLNTSTLERSRLAHNSPSTASSPLRDRFGASLKRRDSAASSPGKVFSKNKICSDFNLFYLFYFVSNLDPTTLTVSRNPSLPTLQTPVISSRETARPRVGYTPSFDGVLNNGESWVARRRASEASLKLGNTLGRDVVDASKVSGIHEEREDGSGHKLEVTIEDQSPYLSSSPHVLSEEPHQFLLATDVHEPLTQGSQLPRKESPSATLYVHERTSPPPGLLDLLAIEWSYKDPTGQIQGKESDARDQQFAK
jgi:PERQ amino acid-rich with GYF domain-containing protein